MITREIRIPQELIGLVIGKGGSTILEISNKTSTVINIPSKDAESPSERIFRITGLERNVNSALTELKELVSRLSKLQLRPEVEASESFTMDSYKTKLCPFNFHDCPRGKKCLHAHGVGELRRNPLIFPYCPEMCHFTKCSLGNQCLYSHNSYEKNFHPMNYKLESCPTGCNEANCHLSHNIRDSLLFSSISLEERCVFKYKTQWCIHKFHHGGSACREGNACWNAHSAEELRRDPRVYNYNPHERCSYGSLKDCPNRSTCPKSHGIYESLYHPTTFKKQRCLSNNCRSEVCPFIHPNDTASLSSDPIFWLTSYKTTPCPTNCKEKNCIHYHNHADSRRNYFLQNYIPKLCHASKKDRACHHHPSCKFCQNHLELVYHPLLYKTSLCQKKICLLGMKCTYAHSQEEIQLFDLIRKEISGNRKLEASLGSPEAPTSRQLTRSSNLSLIVEADSRSGFLKRSCNDISLSILPVGIFTSSSMSPEEIQFLSQFLYRPNDYLIDFIDFVDETCKIHWIFQQPLTNLSYLLQGEGLEVCGACLGKSDNLSGSGCCHRMHAECCGKRCRLCSVLSKEWLSFISSFLHSMNEIERMGIKNFRYDLENYYIYQKSDSFLIKLLPQYSKEEKVIGTLFNEISSVIDMKNIEDENSSFKKMVVSICNSSKNYRGYMNHLLTSNLGFGRLLHHPLFWEPGVKINFLIQSAILSNRDPSFFNELERNKSVILKCSDWRTVISSSLLNMANNTRMKFSIYDGSIRDLLLVIRAVALNLRNWTERPEFGKDDFPSLLLDLSNNGIMEYFDTLFPNLIVLLSELIRSSSFKKDFINNSDFESVKCYFE